MKFITSLVPGTLLAASSSATVLKHNSFFDWSKIQYVYAFGDSYSYVQGTNGYPKFSFIGSEFNKSFTPNQILTDEILYHNTSSGGANWLQFLTSCYEGSPLQCPRQLWDFAYSGADISGDLLPLHHNHTLPLVDQVNMFVKSGAHVLPHAADETLATWWIGVNDCGDAATNRTITDYNKFWEEQMAALFASVTRATTAGGIHSHLFINVPPKEREPSYLGDQVRSTAVIAQVQDFNTAFAASIKGFAKKHPKTNVFSYDAHAFFNKVLDEPAEYGFGNVTGYCGCQDDQYFWWNNGHPTEKVHKLLAEDIERLLVAGNYTGSNVIY